MYRTRRLKMFASRRVTLLATGPIKRTPRKRLLRQAVKEEAMARTWKDSSSYGDNNRRDRDNRNLRQTMDQPQDSWGRKSKKAKREQRQNKERGNN